MAVERYVSRLKSALRVAHDQKRRSALDAILSGGEPELLLEGLRLVALEPRLAPAVPEAISSAVDHGCDGAKDLLVSLFGVDGEARANACDLVVARSWQDEFWVPVGRFVEQGARRKRVMPHGIVEGLEVLRTASADGAAEVLGRILWAGVPIERVRADAVAALGAKARENDRALLVRLAAEDPSWEVQMMARVGLAKLGDRQALRSLREDLADGDLDKARTVAIELQRWLGLPYTVPTLDNYAELCAWWDAHEDEVLARAGN